MQKEFIPYEQALALKELGFDEPCFGYYEPNKEFEYINWEAFKDFPYLAKNSEWQDLCGAATYSQAFRWFREKYGYYYPIHRTTNNTNQVLYSIGPYAGDYFTYEEAELACLKKLIEIVKSKKD
jgi:hypothetical protein